jgi:hypothetical protein
VELGQDLDPLAKSAGSVGMLAGWRVDVTSPSVTCAAGVDVTAVTWAVVVAIAGGA